MSQVTPLDTLIEIENTLTALMTASLTAQIKQQQLAAAQLQQGSGFIPIEIPSFLGA